MKKIEGSRTSKQPGLWYKIITYSFKLSLLYCNEKRKKDVIYLSIYLGRLSKVFQAITLYQQHFLQVRGSNNNNSNTASMLQNVKLN